MSLEDSLSLLIGIGNRATRQQGNSFTYVPIAVISFVVSIYNCIITLQPIFSLDNFVIFLIYKYFKSVSQILSRVYNIFNLKILSFKLESLSKAFLVSGLIIHFICSKKEKKYKTQYLCHKLVETKLIGCYFVQSLEGLFRIPETCECRINHT